METAVEFSLACASCNEDEEVGVGALSARLKETAVGFSAVCASCVEDEVMDMELLSTGPPVESCSRDSLEHAMPRF